MPAAVRQREPQVAVPPAANTNTVTVTDSRRRTLEVKKLSALDRMNIAIALGEHSENRSVALYANLAWSVRKIDGDPVITPRRLLELQALVQRLDEDGLAAVVEAWRAAGWISTEPQEAEQEHGQAVKNSSARPVSETEPG